MKQQDADAAFDTYDTRHASVRWFVRPTPVSRSGPSTVDPRTGEILDAEVAIPEAWSRGDRTFISEQAPPAWPSFDASNASLGVDGSTCTYASEALAEMEFGLDVLEARGDIEPGSPEADAFVTAGLKEVVMHEVGHTLGLAPQLPRVDRLPARQDLRSGIQPWGRHRRLGHGLQPVQHRGQRRVARRICRADNRAVRLLGDRIRLPAAAEGDRGRGAREDRRAWRDRSAARLLVRRGDDRRARPRCQPVRPGYRSASLPAKAAADLARAVGPPPDEDVEAGENPIPSCAAASTRDSGRSAAPPRSRRSTSAASITFAISPAPATCR